MKRILLLAVAVLPALSAFSQGWIDDSVFVTGYSKKIFYSLANGQVGDVAATHDLEVDAEAVSASIRLNNARPQASSPRLFMHTGDTTAFTTVWDTTGMSAGTNANFIRCLDADTLWGKSAFEFGNTNHPDYNWGTYNSTTHNVDGKKVFLIKTHTGDWKRIWIRSLQSMAGYFQVRIADFDGSNVSNVTINKAGQSAKAFIYYDIATNTTSSPEPNKDSYDLIFNRYVVSKPGVSYYGLSVSGVLMNNGVSAARAAGLPAEDAIHTNYTLSSNINIIGDNYKTLNYATFAWEVYDSLSYFISDVNNNIWQLRFTKFGGTASGLNKFQKRQLTFASQEQYSTIPSLAVFPNPATENVNVVYTSSENNPMTIKVIDLAGRVVSALNVNSNQGINQININLSQINKGGMYIIQMNDGKTIRTEKLMIQR